MNRRFLFGTVSASMLVGLTAIASADFVNGSFETSGGSLSGWSKTGDAQVLGASIGDTPTDGTHDALLATQTDSDSNSIDPDVAIGIGISGSALESFLGQDSGALTAVGNGTAKLGSAITQVLTLSAGDKVTFDYNYLTNQVCYDEPDNFYRIPTSANDDFSFLSIVNGSSKEVVKLVDDFYGYQVASNAGGFNTGLALASVNNPFLSETGFLTYTFTAPTSGTYTLGVGVVNATTNPNTNGLNSAVLVDNFHVLPVPEPSSFLGFGVLGVLALTSRKRSQNKA